MSHRVPLPPTAVETLSAWYSPDLLGSVRFLRGSLIGWLFGRFGQVATTINGTIHLTPHAPDLATPRGIALASHELYHVIQQREAGWWRFFLRYLWRWRPGHIRDGRSHPLEAPAYLRGDEVRRALRGEKPEL